MTTDTHNEGVQPRRMLWILAIQACGLIQAAPTQEERDLLREHFIETFEQEMAAADANRQMAEGFILAATGRLK